MVMPNETIGMGAAPQCTCGSKLKWVPHRSGAGWAVWTFCIERRDGFDCMAPYSRETCYFATEKEADEALLRIQSGDHSDMRC